MFDELSKISDFFRVFIVLDFSVSDLPVIDLFVTDLSPIDLSMKDLAPAMEDEATERLMFERCSLLMSA